MAPPATKSAAVTKPGPPATPVPQPKVQPQQSPTKAQQSPVKPPVSASSAPAAESSPGRDHVEKLITQLSKQSVLPSAGSSSVQPRAGVAAFPSTWIGSDVDKPINLIGTLGVDLSFVCFESSPLLYSFGGSSGLITYFFLRRYRHSEHLAWCLADSAGDY